MKQQPSDATVLLLRGLPDRLLSSPLALPFAMGLAFLIRMLHWAAVHNGPFVAELAMDSQEYDRWALAITGGEWLGDEAFFQAPFYPYLLALLYRVVGLTYRLDGAYLLQILVATSAVGALYQVGTLLGGRRLGASASLLFALAGPAVFADVQLLKESLATSLVAFLLWALVAAARWGRSRLWLAVGFLLGAISLLRENALLLVPLFALWGALTTSRHRGRLKPLLFVSLGTAICLLPFVLRNWLVTGETLLTTYQGGVNFYIGNNPDANGTYRPLSPGRQVPQFERREPIRLAEETRGRSLSPGEVSRYWWRLSLDWARSDPGAFLRLQLRKLHLFWTFYEWPDAVDYAWMRGRSPALRLAFVEFGALCLLAVPALWHLRSRWRPWAPVLLVVAAWTAITVAFFVFSRYRLPVFPALALLAGTTVERAAVAFGSSGTKGMTAALATLAALAIPRAVAPEPRLDLMYYNLGLLAQHRGDIAEAKEHFRRVASLDGSNFLARMNLGTLAARDGSIGEALSWFQQAAELEPDSPDVWANLGAGLLASNRLQEAEQALLKAHSLDSESSLPAHNLALTYERLGNDLEARRWNRMVLEREPDHAAAMRLSERLHRVPVTEEPLQD